MSRSRGKGSDESRTSSVVALIRDLLQLYSKRRERLRRYRAQLREQAGKHAARKLSEHKLLSEELQRIAHNQDDEWFELRLIGRALMRSPQRTRSRLLKALPASVFGDVRRRMWAMSDLMRMTNVDVQRVLREVPAGRLAASLAGASQELEELVLRNLSRRARLIVNEEREYLGTPDQELIEDAQQEIADTIGRLVEAEEIALPEG